LQFYIRDTETNQEIVMSRPVLPTFDTQIDGLTKAIAVLEKAIQGGGKDTDKRALAAEKERVEAQLDAVKQQKKAAKA
jgi:hypothetical protein